MWFCLGPRVGDAAAPVEGERDLLRLDAERASRETAPTQLKCKQLGEPECFSELGIRALAACKNRLGAAVREPLAAADHRAVEEGVARTQLGVERHLYG